MIAEYKICKASDDDDTQVPLLPYFPGLVAIFSCSARFFLATPSA